MEQSTSQFRFASSAQLEYMRNLRLPTLIVPLGYRSPNGPWYFTTDAGPILIPIQNEAAQSVVDHAKPTFRIVPGGTAIAVECALDKIDEFDAFEAWLVENEYPYDRIE
jgi:hypothetical protein